MAVSAPTWQLVLTVARDLSARGRSTFKLADLIEGVQRLDPERARGSISPVVQGMTVNAGKGPPSPCGKVLLRVDHGWYQLRTEASVVDDGFAVVPAPPIAEVSAGPSPPGGANAWEGLAAGRGSRRHNRRHGSDVVRERVKGVIAEFDHCVDAYDRAVPFTRSGQYELHRRTIDRRRAIGSVAAAVRDDEFTELLHATLQRWGIGRRASRLVPLEQFRVRLIQTLPLLVELEGLSIEAVDLDVDATTVSLDRLVRKLGVVENVALVVAGTKTLHHVFPDLVPPMDRAWTGAFFGWSPLDPQNNQTRILQQAFSSFAQIARAVQPARLVGPGWRTSTSKLLDNAVIGYCHLHYLGPGGSTRAEPPTILAGHDVPPVPTSPARGLLGRLRGIFDR
jgi:hypothetical protein